MDHAAQSYRRYLQGDDSALAEIIRSYRDGLIFFLNGFVNDIDLAEDLAEEVFIKIAVKKPHFQERSSFKTWLYAIGRNEAYRCLRRQKIVYVSQNEPPAIEQVYDSPEILFFQQEKRRALHRCLAQLKSEYHQVLWLYYFEDMPVKEISVIMNKSVHNVETLLYRARIAVKKAMEAEGFTDENL